MALRLTLQRLAIAASLLVFGVAPAGCLGCGGDPALPAADGLRRDFPEHAALVLEAGRPLIEAPEGFVVVAQSDEGTAAPHGLAATLPKSPEEPVRFALA